jgi:thiamine kinase-like enzyme
MRYYYFNPFSKKCYFPEGFHNYPIFTSFYKPYKRTAKLVWKIWRNSAFVRNFFYTDQPENILPIKQISKYVSSKSILAFNLGTTGIEQKITVLGFDTSTKTSFFIKYATSKVSRNNVSNEGDILQQISHLPFIPMLLLYVKDEKEFTLIKTSVLKGNKMKQQPLNMQILTILFTLSTQNIRSSRNYESDLQNCFAHGDLAPWNMLDDEGIIRIFDWEMAGQYPLGYDLFTYIFQFEFLVNGRMRFDFLLNKNSNIINQYFNNFQIVDWIPYLLEFSKLKYKLESEKKNIDLIEPYLKLKEFASTYQIIKTTN